MCILIHHLYQFTGLFVNTYFGHFLSLLGQWAVTVFTFISGFGLYSSYASKNKEYLDVFLKKRVLPIYLTYVVFVIIYLIYDFRSVTDWKQILRSLTVGGTIFSFGWYFQLIYVLYLGFFIIFRFCRFPKLRSGLMLIFLIGYAALSIVFKQDPVRYIPLASFALGLITAVHNKRIYKVLNRLWPLFLITSFATFFSVYIIYIKAIISGLINLPDTVMTVLITVSHLAVVIFVVTLSLIFTRKSIPVIENPVTQKLGEFSLEIYAFQGLFLRLFINYISNTALYILTSVASILLAAFIFHTLKQLLQKKLNRSNTPGAKS